jgi:hypothetical protein
MLLKLSRKVPTNLASKVLWVSYINMCQHCYQEFLVHRTQLCVQSNGVHFAYFTRLNVYCYQTERYTWLQLTSWRHAMNTPRFVSKNSSYHKKLYGSIAFLMSEWKLVFRLLTTENGLIFWVNSCAALCCIVNQTWNIRNEYWQELLNAI